MNTIGAISNVGQAGRSVIAGSGGVPFVTEYQTVYDSFTTKPSTAIAAAQNTMVESLVSSGVWAKRDIIYLFAQEINTGGEALKNFITPGTFDATLVNAPAFGSLEGFTGNATTNYIKSNWNASTQGVKTTLDDTSVSSYQRTDLTTSAIPKALWGVNDLSRGWWYIVTLNSVANIRVHDDLTLQWAQVSINKGFSYFERTGATARASYLNNVLKNSDNRGSVIISNLEMYLLARNEAGTPDKFIDVQLSYWSAGGSLTAGERLAEMNAVETYMDSNGKGIIT